MRSFSRSAAALALCVAAALAQTITTTDDLGQTIVEVVTIDPIQGIPVTSTISTVTTTPTPPPEIPPVGPGPVPTPGPTLPPGSPTTYTFTTTDVNGNPVVSTGTFTPKNPPTSSATGPPPPGTILNYTQWRSSVGTNTVPPAFAAAGARWKLDMRWLRIASAISAAFTGGAWMVFA